MKIVCAWLLLLLVLSNWIGGFLYIEISYLVEIPHEMNAAEQSIAAAVEQKIGVESVIKILDAQPRLKGDVYGDAAFTNEMSDNPVFYTLLSNNTDVQEFHQSEGMPTFPNEHTLLLKSLFAEFEVLHPHYISPYVLIPRQAAFVYIDLLDHFFNPITTPPPNVS